MSFFGIVFLLVIYIVGLSNYIMSYRGLQRGEIAYSLVMLSGGMFAHAFVAWVLLNVT